MEVSLKAKERFCKDCNIPIKLYREPYFSDRLKLFDKFFGTLEKWKLFVEELEKYHCEQDYFEEYNRVKDVAILSIKNSSAYQEFNNEDMNMYSVPDFLRGLPSKDIFKPSNDKRLFLSIDMKKANFSALHHYSEDMFRDTFGVANTWEEFISKFTDNQHIINSKYIRQVILGNCNPKRHITYEKYIMSDLLNVLCSGDIPLGLVVFFSNDEIIYDVTDVDSRKLKELVEIVDITIDGYEVPMKRELFLLNRIEGTDGYLKIIFLNEGVEYDFKCIDNYMYPFVLRKMLKEDVSDEDVVFIHEGKLARFIEIPDIKISGVV